MKKKLSLSLAFLTALVVTVNFLNDSGNFTAFLAVWFAVVLLMVLVSTEAFKTKTK